MKQTKHPNEVLPVCPLTPGIRGIVLTRGQIAIVDAEDLQVVQKYRWSAVRPHSGGSFYASSGGGKWSKLVTMHRLLHPSVDGLNVDHKDGNGLNNTRSNLRSATYHQNRWNTRKVGRNTSGFKGVSLDKRLNSWRACITWQGQFIHLGYYPTPEEASKAYLKAAKRLQGEFFNPG